MISQVSITMRQGGTFVVKAWRQEHRRLVDDRIVVLAEGVELEAALLATRRWLRDELETG